MVTFEDVMNVSTEEYFNGNQFSIDAFNKKYAQVINGQKETYVQSLKRVCDYIASCESTEELKKFWSDRWFDEIYNDWWHPAGSIMQGAYSGKSISMSNCSTVSLGGQEDTNWDNLESIIKNTSYTVAKMAAYRQGLGVDFSKLRPRGCEVRNSSNESQGVIHWMKFIDSIGNYIGQKGRIPAMLFSLSINHPDVEEFIKVKSDHTIIQNANISVQTNDAFYKAVDEDADWEMSFTIPSTKKGDRVYVDIHSTDMDCKKDEQGRYYRLAKKDRSEEVVKKVVKARYLLELIAKNAISHGEPGIQQIDMAKYWSNSDYLTDPTGEYCPKVISSNACSEQYLSRDSVCVLSSINAGRFSTEKDLYTQELKTISYSVNRFLDNVNEMELIGQTYSTPHQRLAIEKLRRTGAGITNIAAWFFKQNLEYGSEQANEALFDFNRLYNFYLYESSISLGKEKGSFGLFVKEQYEQSPFIKNMIEQGLVFETMRNCTCSSIAPTGCIEENTRIITDRGLVKIKDIVNEYPEEKQFSYNVPETFISHENGTSKVLSFYNNGEVNGYVIEFEDGREIKVSETHRIRILKDGKYDWEYAPNLKIGDIAILCKGSDNEPKQYVKLNTDIYSNHSSSIKNLKYPVELTEELAEIIGLFTGDGSLNFRCTDDKASAIRFTVFDEDIDLVEKIQTLIKKLFNCDVSIVKTNNEKTFTVSIYSVNVCNYFIKNGFSKKDFPSRGVENNYIYHIPEYIFKSPKSVICAYLRGLFEADGTSHSSHISLSSKHKNIMQEVQELLTYVGIQSFINFKKNINNIAWYNLDIRFTSDKNLFKKKIGFLSNRKNNKLKVFKKDQEKIYILSYILKQYRKQMRNKKCNLYNNINLVLNRHKGLLTHINRITLNKIYDFIKFPFNFDNYFNLKIKNITREIIKTYDIEVDNPEHTYVTANGVINHNTLSLMFRDYIISTGVEPAIGMYYWKRTKISGFYEYYFCVPNVVRTTFEKAGYSIPINSDTIKDTWDGSNGIPIAKFINENAEKIGIKFKKSSDIKPLDKLNLMSKLMKYVDSSISVTYSLSENSSWQDIYNLIVQANKKGVKSLAAYKDKKMYGIISYIPFKQLAFELKNDGIKIHNSNFTEEEAKELNLIVSDSVKSLNATPRQKELPCDVYQVKVHGKQYIMVVGLQNNMPYEMFGGLIPETMAFKFKTKKGTMTKEGHSKYKLTIDDSISFNDFGEYFTASEQMLFRMVSISLRHSIPIKYIVDQLGKAAEDVSDLAAATSRVLKKYIIDGESAGGECPSCGRKELIYMDGCISCTCGWSKGCG